MAQGTVWSFSPETISSGPRSVEVVSTLASVHGLKFAAAAWKRGSPGAGLAKVSYSSRVAELLVRQRDGPVVVGRVAEDHARGPQRGQWQRQHAAEGRGIDGDGCSGEASSGGDLGDQAAGSGR